MFDIQVNTKEGLVFCMYMTRDATEEMASVVQDKPLKLTIQQAHDRLGHCNENATRKTAKELGWEITPGSLGPCEACAAAKAKQKNLPKAEEKNEPKEGENCVYLDIASIKQAKGIPRVTRPHWRIMVNERTQLKFSGFFETKNGMVEPTCKQMERWKQSNMAVTHMRLDNAGENKLLKKRSDSSDWKLNIKFEFTARDTPQQNSLAEPSFAKIANHGRALMHRANVPQADRYKVWTDAFDTATKLDGLIVIEIDGVKQAVVIQASVWRKSSFCKTPSDMG